MHIYIVRHAESDANAARTLQHYDSVLSAYGEAQAVVLAKRFNHISVARIISSPYPRAMRTAEKIGEVVSAGIETSDLLINRRKSSATLGLSYDAPELMEINRKMRAMSHDPLWHFSDEENFHDLKKRTLSFLDLLSKRTEATIVVVTHAAIVRYLVMCMIYGEELTAAQLYSFYEHTKVDNTGLTLCEYKEHWRLITWNDRSHLGE